MRAWLPAVALGCVLAVVAVGAITVLRPDARSTADRAGALAQELRCPDCQGLSVADSPTRSAQEIRRQIDELVAGGATDDAVRDHFVERYGQWILLAPSLPLAWLLPFAVVAIGAATLVVWIARRGAPATPTTALTTEERRRLHDEAEALDA